MPWQCRYCSFRTADPVAWQFHKSCHRLTNKEKFSCQLCSFTTQNLLALNEHGTLDHHRDGHDKCPCRSCAVDNLGTNKRKAEDENNGEPASKAIKPTSDVSQEITLLLFFKCIKK